MNTLRIAATVLLLALASCTTPMEGSPIRPNPPIKTTASAKPSVVPSPSCGKPSLQFVADHNLSIAKGNTEYYVVTDGRKGIEFNVIPSCFPAGMDLWAFNTSPSSPGQLFPVSYQQGLGGAQVRANNVQSAQNNTGTVTITDRLVGSPGDVQDEYEIVFAFGGNSCLQAIWASDKGGMVRQGDIVQACAGVNSIMHLLVSYPS